MDLTEAEDTKKRWQEYTEELYRKDLNDPDSHDGVNTDAQKFYEAILPRLSAKGGDENTHLPTFPWKKFGYIFTQLQPEYLASNQPAARF